MQKFKLHLIVIGYCIFFFSCSNNNHDRGAEDEPILENDVSSSPIHYKSPNDQYKKDSFFIVFTAWQFIQKEITPFDFYKTFNVSFQTIKIEIDTILYSPDMHKLFSFVITTYWDGKENKNISVGNGFVGYRNSKEARWKLFNFDQFSTGGFRNYNTVRRLFRDYYLKDGKFKNDSHYYWISNKNKYESIPFKYNLDNDKFWDSSIVWKKGIPISGYYSFEVRDQAKPDDEDAIKLLPHLDYPDSILQMYK